MRTHGLQSSTIASALLLGMGSLGGVAVAGETQTIDEQSKPSEQQARPRKMHATFAPYAPLFLEQKDAPAASKSIVTERGPAHVFHKAKD